MSKKDVLLIAPLLNRSGYGTLADDTFHALNSNPRLNLKAVGVNWGSCVAKSATRDKDKAIIQKCIKEQDIKEQPPISFSVNLPHIQKPIGSRFNINYSAIVEVDKCYPYIIDGVNSHNLQIVCSQFAKDVLLNSDKKPTVPIEVCYWGCDPNTYKPDATPQATVDAELNKIAEAECFLFVGQSTNGRLFCDRKDVDTLVKTFCETFAGMNNKPALVLKTSGTNFSTKDRNLMLERINLIKGMVKLADLPNVYLLHGELSENEMAALYSHKKVIAHVSFTHGESFGMQGLQGCLSGKPTFLPAWSAHTEYLSDKRFLLDGELKVIPQEIVSEFYCAGSKWFYVDTAKAKDRLLHFYHNRADYNEAALALAKINASKFSLNAMTTRLNQIVNKYIK